MTSSKRKGVNAERKLLELLWKYKFAAVRVAGSACSKYPMPDIVAGKGEKKFAIECKLANAEKIYVSERSIAKLLEFSHIFGCKPILAVNYNKEWFFFEVDGLHKKFEISSAKRFEEVFLSESKDR